MVGLMQVEESELCSLITGRNDEDVVGELEVGKTV